MTKQSENPIKLAQEIAKTGLKAMAAGANKDKTSAGFRKAKTTVELVTKGPCSHCKFLKATVQTNESHIYCSRDGGRFLRLIIDLSSGCFMSEIKCPDCEEPT
ncbi:MAG: hypothetical protein Fur0024_4200 [Patescibacteria group bacterium]